VEDEREKEHRSTLRRSLVSLAFDSL
jgi:hypothetical protein